MQISLVLQNALQDYQQSGQLKRLGQELLGALFDCSHCQVDGTMGSEDEQRDLRVDLFQPRQQIKRSAVGEQIIRHHYVRTRGPKALLSPPATVSFIDFVALQFEVVAHAEAQTGLVIND